MNAMNNLKILYEDNHIIVVVKPANVLTQSDATHDNDMLSIIKKYLKEKYNKPGNVYLGMVHRLDRPVSGVMVFAKTSKAANRLSEQIRNHSFSKKYLAIVHGINLEDVGNFTDYIVKRNDNSSYITDSVNGKICKLSYKVIERDKGRNLSLVEIDLKTGRHHQIRVQFSSRGYPLYGDQRYGTNDRKQIALLAYKIEFLHPVKKEKMTFECEKPDSGIWKCFEGVKYV